MRQELLVLPVQLVLLERMVRKVQQEPMEQTVLLAPRAIKAYKV